MKNLEAIFSEAIEELESVANLLRGMALDPRCVFEMKAVMRERASRIDAFTEQYSD